MKRSPESLEMTPFNGAAFRVGAEAFRGGRLELLLEETLAQVFGGADSLESAACTEFTCNVYAPPPPR